MCKCKRKANAAKAGASVYVTVNVTNIVKYISLAGAAIVGIIFAAKCYIERVKSEKNCAQK